MHVVICVSIIVLLCVHTVLTVHANKCVCVCVIESVCVVYVCVYKCVCVCVLLSDWLYMCVVLSVAMHM